MRYQQADIIGATLKRVRDVLGEVVFSMEMEKKIEAAIRLEFGGQEVYVRMTRAGSVDARALAIRAEYNMCNRRELQQKYGLGRAQFYKILKGA